MTSKFEDRITVQSVSQTTAGEYREWTITVREGSARAHAVPAGCVPAAVHEAICDWLDVPRPREARAATATPEEPAQPQDEATEDVGLARNPRFARLRAAAAQIQDGPPLLAGRDFAVGDRPTDASGSMLIAPQAMTAARDHENTIQRAEPNPNLLTLWNNTFTEHLDVYASVLTDRGNLRLRVHFGHRPLVQQFVRDHDGDLHARWRGGTWRIRSVSAPRGHLDVELEETRPGPEPIEAPKPFSLADLDAMKGDKASCPGCTNPTEHGHYPWCPNATDANLYRAPRADRFYREPEPARPNPLPPSPEMALPDRDECTCPNCERTKAAPVAPEAYNRPEYLGTVPEYGEPCCAGDGDGFHELGCPATTPVPPMPGDPDDKLTQAARPPITFHSNGKVVRAYVDSSTPSADNGHTVLFTDPYVRQWIWDTPASVTATWDGRTWKVEHVEFDPSEGDHAAVELRPADVTTTGPLADLYARLDHLHDAVAEEDDQ